MTWTKLWTERPAVEEGARRVQGLGCRVGMEEGAKGQGGGSRRRVQGTRSRAQLGSMYLSGPQVQLLERRQFDEVLSAGTGYIGEGQTEVLQVSEGARAQQTSQVCVLQTDRQAGSQDGLGLRGASRDPERSHLLSLVPQRASVGGSKSPGAEAMA